MPPAQASDVGTIIWASLALIVLCIVGFFAVATLRRKLKDDDTATNAGGGFTLDDLRTLLAQGKMSQDEFDRAKHQIVAAMKARQAKAVLQKQEDDAKSRIRGGAEPRPSPRSGPIHHDRPPLD